MEDIILELKGIKKDFGGTEVLNEINLTVKRGEFITLLGSSGCGKTTTLRIISGLETPSSGKVLLEGTDVTCLEPEKRNVNTVFQNYALFPHMNVFDNIGYGLKLKKIKKDEIKKRVTKTLELVRLAGFEKRMPSEMSGGQKQRVAIARAIVNEPKVLLLDEPLGALDLQLRRQMQLELKKLQKSLGITFIYITHDQEEAINMSDRIAVMREGKFEQIGSANEIYDQPKTSYVAKFVGNANILTGKILRVEKNQVVLECQNGLMAAELPRETKTLPIGRMCHVSVRSENIHVSKEKSPISIEAAVREKTFAGGLLRIEMELKGGETIAASRHGLNAEVEPSDRVYLSWERQSGILVDLSQTEV